MKKRCSSSIRSRRRLPPALAISALALAACGAPATAPLDDAAAPEPATVKAKVAPIAIDAKTAVDGEQARTGFDCPVTIPPQPGFVPSEPDEVTYSEHFPEPDPWPSEYPHEGLVWYGSAELWTALAVDGDHGGRKSVWWSANFPGGIVEERPAVSVTWTRLGTDEPQVIDNGGEATNAFIPDEGWFMIAGIDPDQGGCWHVEATYKNATLSYVYERPPA